MPSARSSVRLNRPGASIHANHNPDNTISFNHTTAPSKQLKSDLVRLARHFRLRHQSKTVPELRTMLKEHLDNNRDRLATSNRYRRLYVQPKGTQPPQDEQHVSDDGDEWRGISDRSDENESEDENPDEPRQRLGRAPTSTFSGSSKHISSDMSTRYTQTDRDPGGDDRDHARHLPRRRDDRQPQPLWNGSNKRHSRIVPGTMAVGAGYVVPDTVRKSMSAGWKHHISLHLLTDAHCIYTHSIAKPDGFYFDTTTGKFTISSIDSQVSAKDEEDLSFDEWHQAWRRFLTLLREFFPREHPYWRVHFENILNAPTRAEHWYLWLAYDIEIRRRSISEPIDPSIHHTGVWKDLEPRYQRKVAEDLVRQLLTQQFDGGLWTAPLKPIEETGF